NAYDRREFLIPPMSFRDLLEQLIERNLLVEVGNEFYKEIEIKRDETPLTFSVAQDRAKQLMLHMKGVEGTKFFLEYKTLFYDGAFYFPNENQLAIMTQVRRLGMADHQLPISSDSADTFFSEALPVLKQASQVNVEEQVTEEII